MFNFFAFIQIVVFSLFVQNTLFDTEFHNIFLGYEDADLASLTKVFLLD